MGCCVCNTCHCYSGRDSPRTAVVNVSVGNAAFCRCLRIKTDGAGWICDYDLLIDRTFDSDSTVAIDAGTVVGICVTGEFVVTAIHVKGDSPEA